MTGERCDIIVIGGGIVGLSVAMQITRRFPRMKLTLLEKEAGVGRHQTGHNSGVIHSGIYYPPGSIKARTCVEGATAMVEFCRAHNLPLQVCGKVIVATSQAERPRLNDLLERGRANGISGLRLLNREQLREIEPHAEGLAALHVPGTGITDFSLVCEKFADITRAQGGALRMSAQVIEICEDGRDSVVNTTEGTFRAGFLINCAGLFSDRVGQLAGETPPVRIIPFRGEYYGLVPEKEHLVRGLIYPVPDPGLPFLGVHFTRRVHGGVDAGPNAVFAFSREGYRRTDFSTRDTLASLSFPGFWRMAARLWRSGVGETYRSLHKRAFTAALQKMVPEVREEDLRRGGSGVRAQAVARDGRLLDDFLFSRSGNRLHLYNVPSPAATASIAVGRAIVEMAAEAFSWQ